jgi:hypothetical protein
MQDDMISKDSAERSYVLSVTNDSNQIQGRNCAIGLKCTCYYVLVSLCPPPVVLVGLQSVDDSQGRANTSFHPRTPGHDK